MNTAAIASAALPSARRLALAGLIAGAAVLAACAPLGGPSAPPATPPLPQSTPEQAGRQVPAPEVARRGPFADRRIELAGRCNQVDEDGFAENAVLDVRDNQVVALNWDIKIGRRGTCTFHGSDFRQVKSHPHIELRANDGSACKLMVWQEPRRVTLAHSGCERWCTPRTVYDKAWPVMFDPSSGGCARTG